MYEKHEMESIAFSENDSFVFADKSEDPEGWDLFSVDPEKSDI